MPSRSTTMNAASDREFAYRPGWKALFLCAVFFGICAAVLGAVAATNERGLVINRIFEFGSDDATIVYWVLCVCSIGFLVAIALLAVHRVLVPQRIVIGSTAIRVPKSRWSSKEKEIAYQDIATLSLTETSGYQFLHITHSGGKVTIMAALLPSKSAFYEIYEQVDANVRKGKKR
jgi:hypothetical protein